jgi:TetR/AcrR family transcriptional repressor of nem operon
MATTNAGRPRSFDEQIALRCAVDLFWEKGYAATSLDDLLSAMNVARSSFYATFGSKRKVLLAALVLYTDELVTRMRDAAAAEPTPRRALEAVLAIAGCSVRPTQGCLFVNIATELAPTDLDVRRIGQDYLGKVDRLIRSLLRRCGFDTTRASDTSATLMALTTGAVTLRKAGASQARVRRMLDAANRFLD